MCTCMHIRSVCQNLQKKESFATILDYLVTRNPILLISLVIEVDRLLQLTLPWKSSQETGV